MRKLAIVLGIISCVFVVASMLAQGLPAAILFCIGCTVYLPYCIALFETRPDRYTIIVQGFVILAMFGAMLAYAPSIAIAWGTVITLSLMAYSILLLVRI